MHDEPEAPSNPVLTVRLPLPIKKRLERLAQATSQSKSWLATDAITQYLDIEEWQTREIQDGLQEAEQGDWASEKDVEQVFSRWLK